jgi:hypothetical protein
MTPIRRAPSSSSPIIKHCFMTTKVTTTITTKTATIDDDETTSTSIISENKKNPPLYLHVGPSGDCWTGHSIFAAKHNQPGYIKSIPLMKLQQVLLHMYGDNGSKDDDDDNDDDNDDDEEETTSVLGYILIGVLEQYPECAYEIYDTECIPKKLQQYLLEEEEIISMIVSKNKRK